MPWFKVDDTLHGHPKARRVGLAAMGLWALGGSYASQYATDGFVPEWFVLGWPQGRKRAAELVAVGMWLPAVVEGEPGWRFHDWEHYQLTREEVEEDRALNRERQRRFRERRREGRNALPNGEGNGSDLSRDDARNAVSNGTPTLPNPTRPSLVSSSVGEDGSPNPNRHLGDAAKRDGFGLGRSRR